MTRLLDNHPRFLRHFHGLAVITWAALVIPTLIWWKDSVLWVALMSIWANVAAHWSAWNKSGATTTAAASTDG